MWKPFREQIHLRLSAVLVAIFVLHCAACETRPPVDTGSGPSGSPNVARPKIDPILDQKTALTITPKVEDMAMEEKDLKPALLRTVDAHSKAFSPVALTKEEINESPIIVRKELDGLIEIGNFRCDLKAKTFAYITAGGEGRGYRAKEGRFVLNERSEWVGEITNVVSGHK